MEHYEKVFKIGNGSQGSVYHVRSKENKCEYALKVIPCPTFQHSNLSLKEAKILSQLKHPNIVSYIDFFLDENLYDHENKLCICLLMELCLNGDLSIKIQQTRNAFMQSGQLYIDDRAVLLSMQQITSAVDFLHNKEFLHRDIKPTNIFFTADGTVKLGDFGLATPTRIDLNQTTVGTPFYVAPELLMGIKYGKKVDIWGTAVSFYELITLNERPMNRISKEEPAQFLNTVVQKIVEMGHSRLIANLFAIMMHPDPELRPNAKTVLEKIDLLMGKTIYPPLSEINLNVSKPNETDTIVIHVPSDVFSLAEALNFKHCNTNCKIKIVLEDSVVEINAPMKIFCRKISISGLEKKTVLKIKGCQFFCFDSKIEPIIELFNIEFQNCCERLTCGNWIFEKCDFISSTAYSLHVYGSNTLLKMKNCTFKNSGIHAGRNSSVEIDNTEFFGGEKCGILLKGAKKVLLKNCCIKKYKDAGIYIFETNDASISECQLLSNYGCGVIIQGAQTKNVCLKNAKIIKNAKCGVFFTDNAFGIVYDCIISCCGKCGIEIKKFASPIVKNNIIKNCEETGIYITDNGAGTIESNTIVKNKNAGVLVTTRAQPIVKTNNINDNFYEGLWVYNEGNGTLEQNNLTNNHMGPLDIGKDCKVTLIDNTTA